MEKWIEKIVCEKMEILSTLKNCGYLDFVEKVGDELSRKLKEGYKVLLAGNGGSAADAQHFAGEIVGRFTMERNSLPAVSLCVDPSVVTCIANDYGYDNVFSRQVEGIGKAGDILVVISTSGNSKNCINAVNSARQKNIKTVALLGKDGGELKDICDYSLIVPSSNTPRIQEIHTFTVHLLCEYIEKAIFS